MIRSTRQRSKKVDGFRPSETRLMGGEGRFGEREAVGADLGLIADGTDVALERVKSVTKVPF